MIEAAADKHVVVGKDGDGIDGAVNAIPHVVAQRMPGRAIPAGNVADTAGCTGDGGEVAADVNVTVRRYCYRIDRTVNHAEIGHGDRGVDLVEIAAASRNITALGISHGRGHFLRHPESG